MRFSGNLLQFTCLVHVILGLTAFDEKNERNMNYDGDYFADVFEGRFNDCRVLDSKDF